MTLNKAIEQGKKRVKQSAEFSEVFIVWSCEDGDNQGEHYHLCRPDELEGFFLGCDAVAVISGGAGLESIEVSL